MKMLCPNVKCPRRDGCKSALPHEETKHCKDGCQLHPRYDGDKQINMRPCIKW